MSTHKCKLPRDPSHEENVTRSKYTGWYKKSIQIWDRNPHAVGVFRSEYEIELERRRHAATYPSIIHPCSKFRFFYEAWLIFLTLLTSAFYPIYASFPTWDNHENVFHVDLFTYVVLSVLNIFDMVMALKTGFISNDNKIICDPKKIKRRYMRSHRFIFDVLMFFAGPINAIAVFIVSPGKPYVMNEICLLYIFKLARLFRHLKNICEFAGLSDRNFNILRCWTSFVVIFHWFACVYIMISKYRWIYGKDYPHVSKRSWMSLKNITTDTPFPAMYLLGLYRGSSSLLCIKRGKGFRKGRAWEEAVFVIVVYIFGRFFMAYVTVVFVEVFLGLRRKEREYQETRSEILGYLRRKNLPEVMQKRIVQYYEYKYNRTIFKENQIFASLSNALVAKFQEQFMKAMRSVTFFDQLSKTTVNCISKHMKSEVFLENDVIIKAGQEGESMYFILAGTVAVLTPSGEEICHLQDGAYFGEIALLVKNAVSPVTIFAIERCTLFRLDKSALKMCVKDKLAFQELERKAAQRQAEVEKIMEQTREAKAAREHHKL